MRMQIPDAPIAQAMLWLWVSIVVVELLRGVFVGSRDMFESMNKLLTARQIKPVIDRVFDFTEARAALTHLEGASHFGKVVIRIG